jgi:hypothetical protein
VRLCATRNNIGAGRLTGPGWERVRGCWLWALSSVSSVGTRASETIWSAMMMVLLILSAGIAIRPPFPHFFFFFFFFRCMCFQTQAERLVVDPDCL